MQIETIQISEYLKGNWRWPDNYIWDITTRSPHFSTYYSEKHWHENMMMEKAVQFGNWYSNLQIGIMTSLTDLCLSILFSPFMNYLNGYKLFLQSLIIIIYWVPGGILAIILRRIWRWIQPYLDHPFTRSKMCRN